MKYRVRNRFTGTVIGTWDKPEAMSRSTDTDLPMLAAEEDDFHYMLDTGKSEMLNIGGAHLLEILKEDS
jgi:hypothetical protein